MTAPLIAQSVASLTAAGAILARNANASRTWSSGGAGYDRISRQIADAIEHTVDRLSPRSGAQVLDVATGTGWTARRAQARGAVVTGIDFGPDVVAAARELDLSGVIDYRVADAESLPFADATFDGVISTFGVMFAGNQQQAAAELARVCRPGGTLALATWPTFGGVFDMFQVIKSYLPKTAPPPPSPFEWGRRERLTEYLGEWFELEFEDGISFYRESVAESAWEAFSQGYGPVVSLLRTLDDATAERFRDDFVEFHRGYDTGVGILVPRPYVITVGRRKS